MKRTCAALLLLIAFSTPVWHTVLAQGHPEPERKDVFKDAFPLVITFRGEYINSTNSSYSAWAEGNLPSDGVFKKYVNWDEMDHVNLETQEWATTFAETYPGKLMLLHWDAREHRNDQPGISDRYGPGHWLSFPGSTLAAAVSSSGNELYVSSSAPFNKKYTDGSFKTPTVLIVELDGQGNRQWDKYEFAEITCISGNTLTVTRGTALSAPRGFPAGSYVAPMATRLGNPGLFDYNFSTLCPEKDGKKATDVLLEEMLSLFREWGALTALDGIALDVLQYAPVSSELDTDNDGIADGGVIDGVNYFRKGALQFQQALRDSLGDRYIITGDSYQQRNQRAVHLFNGMESEGLVEHNDAFRGFAKTINVFTFWQANTKLPYKISYLVDKIKNETDLDNTESLTRLAFGTATCLGIAMTRSQGSDVTDEMNGGLLNRQHWLGKPESGMIQLAGMAPDLFEGAGISMSQAFTEMITATNCEIATSGDTLIVCGSAEPGENMIIEFKGLDLGTCDGDLTLYFELADGGADTLLPRTVSAHVEGLPVYESSGSNNNMYNDLWGYFSRQNTPISLYYRSAGGRDIDLRLEFEGQGTVKMCKMTAHNFPMLLAREFKNGVVLVNPSLSDVSFLLSEIFPGAGLKKLNGISHPGYNNGEPVGGTVEVPALNALFLLKESSSAFGINEEPGPPRVWYSETSSLLISEGVSPGSQLLVYDLTGRLRNRFDYSGIRGKFPVGDMEAGIYLVNIIGDRLCFSTGLFIP